MEKINTSGPFRVITRNKKIFIVGGGAIWKMTYHSQASEFLNQIKNRTWTGWKPKIEDNE